MSKIPENRRRKMDRNGRKRGVLIVVCCNCGRKLGEKDAEGAEGGVSDGLCPRCAEVFTRRGIAEAKRMKRGK